MNSSPNPDPTQTNANPPADLVPLFLALGCPPDKAPEMARQLDRRARQLAEDQGRPYEEALTHLLGLMKQGWAAKDRGL